MARLRKRRNQKVHFQFFRERGGDGATFQTKAETARLSTPRRRRRDFSDQGGDGPTKKHIFATVVEAARLSRSEWRQRDVPDRGGDGVTFLTEAETARLFRPRRRRRDFPDRGGDGATFQTKARLRSNSSQPWWMWRDFSNQSGDGPDQGAYGATFQTKAETARLSGPRRRRRDFSDQDGDHATFQTKK